MIGLATFIPTFFVGINVGIKHGCSDFASWGPVAPAMKHLSVFVLNNHFQVQLVIHSCFHYHQEHPQVVV